MSAALLFVILLSFVVVFTLGAFVGVVVTAGWAEDLAERDFARLLARSRK